MEEDTRHFLGFLFFWRNTWHYTTRRFQKVFLFFFLVYLPTVAQVEAELWADVGGVRVTGPALFFLFFSSGASVDGVGGCDVRHKRSPPA